jgi:GR25 family glycosyltransferase involved in LPS biosynthesis
MKILFIILCILYLCYILRNSRENVENVEDTENTEKVNVYYINMASSKERNQKVIDQFSKVPKVHLTRIDAVTPKDINPYDMQLLKNVCSINEEVEFACLFSHLKAIHKAYHDNNKYALIIEDDIIIDRMLNLDNLISTAPEDWDILQLFTFNTNVYTSNELWSIYNIANYSTLAYLIHRNAMKKILTLFFPSTYEQVEWDSLKINVDKFKDISNCAADYSLYYFLKTYTCNDLLFYNEGSESTIHDSHINNQNEWKNSILNHFKEHGYKNEQIAYKINN